jgi:putative flippase GtrA
MKNLKITRKTNSKLNVKKQIVKYAVSGGVYFWTGYVAFFAFDKGLHWTLFYAKVIADIVGWVCNYALQRYWVFNNPSLAKLRTSVTTRYLIITAIDFLIDYIIVKELKNLGLTPYLGQFVSAGFFTVWNYFWYRFWVFPQSYSRKTRTT